MNRVTSEAEVVVRDKKRHLRVAVSSYGGAVPTITVGVYAMQRRKDITGPRIAFAYADGPGTCRLSSDDYGGASLWVGHACFDVSASEAERIAATFKPHGLRDEREATKA